MLHFGVISLLPEMFDSLGYGITGRGLEQQLIKIDYWNPRDWAKGNYRQVDDKPYGGGPGMVMMYEPLHAAILQAKKQLPMACKTIYLSPQGTIKHQLELKQLIKEEQSFLFICGRYEGVDERIIENDIDEEWSLGDLVLSGGELAAMVYIDAITRLLPGSLGHQASAQQDSFMEGLLDFPHYTRPAEVDGLRVPDVLLSGHNEQIDRWRRKQALGKTWLKRPDLLELTTLNDNDKQLLIEFKQEYDA